MVDVASAQSENDSLRRVRLRLLQWESKENQIAGLTRKQEECIEILTCKWKKPYEESLDANATSTHAATLNEIKIPITELISETFQDLHKTSFSIKSMHDFLLWYDSVNTEIHKHTHISYERYLEQLEIRSQECQIMLDQVELAMRKLITLKLYKSTFS